MAPSWGGGCDLYEAPHREKAGGTRCRRGPWGGPTWAEGPVASGVLQLWPQGPQERAGTRRGGLQSGRGSGSLPLISVRAWGSERLRSSLRPPAGEYRSQDLQPSCPTFKGVTRGGRPTGGRTDVRLLPERPEVWGSWWGCDGLPSWGRGPAPAACPPALTRDSAQHPGAKAPRAACRWGAVGPGLEEPKAKGKKGQDVPPGESQKRKP